MQIGAKTIKINLPLMQIGYTRPMRFASSVSRPLRCAGFSLVELSIVVAILSVVATMGLEAAANFVNRSAGSLTRERLTVVDDALLRFFRIYGRLPCPAVLTTPPTNTAYGQEDCTNPTLVNNTGPGGGVLIGALPFRTLNLPMSYSLEGFNDKLNYAVTVNFTSAGKGAGQFGYTTSLPYSSCTAGTKTLGMASTSGLSVGLQVYLTGDSAFNRITTVTTNTSIVVANTPSCTAGTGNVVANQPAGIEVRTGILDNACSSNCQKLADPTPSSGAASGAAYFVFSSGSDKRGAYSQRGDAQTACTQTTATSDARVDAQNCLRGSATEQGHLKANGSVASTIGFNVFYDNRYNAGLNPAKYYDDYAIWRTKDQL